MILAPTDIYVILPSFLLSLSLSLSLSLTSHLSSLHLPLSLPLTSSSPTLSPPRLFISLISSSPIGFSPLPLHLPWIFPSPLLQLIVPSISYLNSPLPTTPTIGDVALVFFAPMLLWWFVYERCNFFLLFLFDSICGFCGMCYY